MCRTCGGGPGIQSSLPGTYYTKGNDITNSIHFGSGSSIMWLEVYLGLTIVSPIY